MRMQLRRLRTTTGARDEAHPNVAGPIRSIAMTSPLFSQLAAPQCDYKLQSEFCARHGGRYGIWLLPILLNSVKRERTTCVTDSTANGRIL
jgi:hypothetical protein